MKERIMKKLITFALIGMLFLSACGDSNSNPDNANKNSSSELQESSAGRESDAEQTQTDQTAALPIVKVENRHLLRYTEDGEVLLSELEQDNITLDGIGYEKAAETVKRLFYVSDEAMERTVDDYAEMAQEQYEFVKDQGWFANYVSVTTYEIARLDTKVLSVKCLGYDYFGGAHNNSWIGGATIDLESGLELELSRLADDAAGFMDKTLEFVIAELGKRQDELYEDYESYVKENLENTDWYLDAAGIEFTFSPYAIGPYSSGSIIVCVPYEEVAEYMKPEYLDVPGEYIRMLPAECEAADREGTYRVSIEYRQTGEYMEETYLHVNGKEQKLGEHVYMTQAYLMRRANGRNFLVYTVDWASDDYETYVCELTAEGAVQTDSIWARIDGKNMNPKEMNLRFSLDILGTYSSQMRYELSEEGVFTALDNVYSIQPHQGGGGGLVTIKALPVKMDGQETTLPSGSKISVTATDNAGTAWFEGIDASGKSVAGEIHYERREDEWQLYIDGVSEYEYFEMLPYAG